MQFGSTAFEFGLSCQLIGIQHEVSVESGAGVGSPEEEEGEKEELLTKKPDRVVLPEDMTAMQIDCGTFHTGM